MDYEAILNQLAKLGYKAPAAESGVNKAALDTLKSARNVENKQAAQLAAGTESPLTQKLDLSGIDKSQSPPTSAPSDSNLPAISGSRAVTASDVSGVPALSKDAEVVGQGSSKVAPSDLPIKDADIATQQANVSPVQAELPGPVNPLQSKWQQLKDISPYVAAAGAGTAAGLMTGGGGSGSVTNNASTKAPVPTPVEKTAPAKAVNEQDDEEDDETPSTSRPNAKSAPGSAATAQPSVASAATAENLGSVDKLRQLQSQMQQQLGLNEAGRNMANTVYAMAGRTNPFERQFEDQAKQIGLAPEQYIQQVQFQKQDPSSPVSQAYRDLAKFIDPSMPISGQMSAADLEKINPELGLVKTREDMIAMRGEAAKDRLSEQQYRNEVLKSNLQDKKDALQTTRFNQTVQQLEQMRGSPAVSQAEKDIYASQKANSLVNSMGGDPNKLNPQQVALLVNEVGKIASGGQSSQSELNVLRPDTLRGEMAGVWQKLSNAPSPANAGAFVKQYQNYANTITNDAKKVVKDRYGRIINSRASQFNPDQLDQLNQNYINRFDVEPAPIKAPQPSSQAPVTAQPAAPAAAPSAPPAQSLQDAASAEIARRKAAKGAQ